MSVIDTGHPSINQTMSDYWKDELKNTKILLNAIDTAIYEILQKGVQSYTLDTGQNSQTVTRANIPALIQQRTDLESAVNRLELKLNMGQPAVKQVIPGF